MSRFCQAIFEAALLYMDVFFHFLNVHISIQYNYKSPFMNNLIVTGYERIFSHSERAKSTSFIF